jgi:hypothetical protein
MALEVGIAHSATATGLEIEVRESRPDGHGCGSSVGTSRGSQV